MSKITPTAITSQDSAAATTGDEPTPTSQQSPDPTEPDQPHNSASTITTRHHIIPALPLSPAVGRSTPHKRYPFLPPPTHHPPEDGQPAVHPDTRTALTTPSATAAVEPEAAVMAVLRDEAEAAGTVDATGGGQLMQSPALGVGGESSSVVRGGLPRFSISRGRGRHRGSKIDHDSSNPGAADKHWR